MKAAEAGVLLRAERQRVEQLLEAAISSGLDARSAAGEPGDSGDSAETLVDELIDDAVAADLRERLEAIGRAERRLADGTFGRSVRSGEPIDEDRLRADPAAELTAEEARAAR
jgi:DnaK suppressor protein